MNVNCPKCGAAYEVDAARIPLGGIDMKCSRCLHTFQVNPHAPPPAAPAGGPNLPGVTFLGHQGGASSSRSGEEKFFIQRQSGKVFGPFEKRLILQMLKAGKLSGQEGVSRDKSFWVPMTAVPEFKAFLDANSAPDPRNQTFLGLPNSPQDPPTVEVPGFQDLAQAASMSGSPWGDSSGVAELPGVRSSEHTAFSGLPGVAGGAELPAPSPNASGFMGAELPGLTGGAELPAPQGSPWGDNADMAELPGLTGGAELPPPYADIELPGMRDDAELPGLAGGGAELPGLAGGAELPGLAGGPELPGLARGPELPGLAGGPELPGQAGGGAELPGLAGAELPGLAGVGAQLPGLPSGAELPGVSRRGPELPGVSRRGPELPGVMGDSSLPGVSGGRAELPQSRDGDAELPGVQGARLPQSRGGVDLPTSGHGRLEQRPELPLAQQGAELPRGSRGPAHLPTTKAGGDDGDDLFADPDMGEPFGAFDANEQVEAVSVNEGAGADPRHTLGQAPVVSPDLDAPPEAAQEPAAPQKGKKKKKKRNVKSSLALSAAIGMLAFSLIIVVGLIAWQVGAFDGLLGEDTVVAPAPKPVEVVAPREAPNLRERLRLDTFKTYQDFVQGTAHLAGQAPQDNKLKGQLLLGYALYLAHYPQKEEYRKAALEHAQALAQAEGPYASLGVGAQKVVAGDVKGAREALEPLTKQEDQDLVYFAHLLLGLQAWMLPESPTVARGDQPGEEAGAQGDVMDFVDEQGAPSGDVVASSRAHLEEAARLQPKAPAPRFFLGKMAQRAGDFKEAGDFMGQAIKLAPGHVPSLLARARLAYLSGRLEAVGPDANKVLGELAEHASKRESSQAQLLLGLQLSARRSGKEAIAAMTESLKIDPTNHEALKALGEEFFREQKFEEALNYYTTNSNLSQQDPEVMFGIVKSFTGLGKLKEAGQKLESGAEAFPTDPRFPFYLGRLREKEGDWKDAEARYRAALQVDPNFTQAHVRLALLLLRDNQRRKEAQSLLSQAEKLGALQDPGVAVNIGQAYLMMGKEDRALQALNRALRLNASNLDARLQLSRYYLNAQKPDKALEMLQPFLKGDVDDPDLRLLLADIYRAREEFEKSIEQLDRLVEVNPKSPLYLYKRGLVYFDWKNLETARKQFLKAYALDPNFVDAYFYVGRVDFERKDYPQAIKAFRASLDEQPSNGDYRFYMAFALERSGNLTQALEEYTALDRFSSDYAKRNPEVYYRRGRIMALQGNYRKAKQDLGKILERDNEHFGALVALADTFFDERKYKQAVELYDRALEQNDQVAYVHYRLGLAYRFLKKRSEALRSLQEAIDLGIKDPKVHRIMGFDYRDIGQSGKAVGSFKAYLAQRPDASDKKEIEKQIRRLGGSL